MSEQLSNTLSLAGRWRRYINETQVDFVDVPGSYPPVGECVLERTFDLTLADYASRRLFLVTEGVLASATFSVNGHEIGTAAAWATYRFELPAGMLKPKDNVISVQIVDLPEAFGPIPGRRWDGGLFRPIWIESRPQSYLADVVFRTTLSADFKSATGEIIVEIDGAYAGPVEIALTELETGQRVATGTAAASQSFRFDIKCPRLWSPEAPRLYSLTARLPGAPGDSLHEQVGFRQFETAGRDLLLNGTRLLLKGVCRHEFTATSSYSASEDEAYRDLARIKHAGFNYVRLVHSPQAKEVCRMAAQLGLLVTEEPGTCWHDLSNPAIAEPAAECLRRTVIRDRNVPSILAWHIYNECKPDVAYAVRMAQMCREIDPGCRLSMADVTGDDAAVKQMADAADITYYGINIYDERKAFLARMKALDDRPIVVTEWSGFHVLGNERRMRDYCEMFVRHTRTHEPLRLAGGSIWAWQDYEEHTRPAPATVDGWTIEGLIDSTGNAKPELSILSQMCFEIDHPPLPRASKVEILLDRPRRDEVWAQIPLHAGDQTALEERMDALRRYEQYDRNMLIEEADGYAATPPMPRLGRMLVDGIEFACADEYLVAFPLLLGSERALVSLPIRKHVTGVAVLGNVCVGGGYPTAQQSLWPNQCIERGITPKLGEPAAEYEFIFADRASAVVPLRHGIEILRHNNVHRWWTPSPRSGATRPALQCTTDTRAETFRLDLWERDFEPGELVEIRWRLLDSSALLVLAGLSVRTE